MQTTTSVPRVDGQACAMYVKLVEHTLLKKLISHASGKLVKHVIHEMQLCNAGRVPAAAKSFTWHDTHPHIPGSSP